MKLFRVINLLKFRSNGLITNSRPFGISSRLFAISGEEVNKKQTEVNRKFDRERFLSSFVSASLAVVLGIGIILKKRKDKKAKCEENPNKVKEKTIENYSGQSADIFLIDTCFKEAIKKSKAVLERIKRENNCPAITITVSVDGREIWSEGLGFSDIENDVKCTNKSVFRIASVSKPITMAIVGKLVEEGLLDLDVPVQRYVPEWPDKYFNGVKTDITTRHIVSMLSGIRHYNKDCVKSGVEKKDAKKKDKKDSSYNEFHINKPYRSVSESLNLFKNDNLCSLPGTEYLYSTHNWTLLSAVIEKVSGKKIEDLFQDLFIDLGLKDTHLDLNSTIINNRARYYSANQSGKLQNAYPVDNSYKWAGGGLQATSSDVCKFGNMMLAFYQGRDYKLQEVKDSTAKNVSPSDNTTVDPVKKPYLSRSTMQMIWTPVKNTKCNWDRDGSYAMGWCHVPQRPMLAAQTETQVDYSKSQYFSHTGAAMGASSVLLVMPRNKKIHEENKIDEKKLQPNMPKGTVVSIITNMHHVQLNPSALEIAAIFESAREFHVKNKHNFFQYFTDEENNMENEMILSLYYAHE